MSTKQEIDHDKRKFIFKETCRVQKSAVVACA
jgi:hypothetical protein